VRPRGFVAVFALAVAIASPRAALAAGSTCSIANVTPLVFGVYEAGQSHPLDAVGELDLLCSATTPVQISMGRGQSGRVNPRAMTSFGTSFFYNVFQDAACTSVWGDGTGGSQLYAVTATLGQTLRLPMYGRIYPLQSIPPGQYRDQIAVFVVF
jgi:spore coat protein U-like protein